MKKLQGFTIVEVLIVIVIIGMVMVVGSVRFRDFSRRQMVVSVKRQMLADIRAAQSDATSGRKPAACTTTLSGYEFYITGTNPGRYRIRAACATPPVLIKTVNLPAGISLSQTTTAGPDVNPVLFKPVAQGTNLEAGREKTITITNSGVNSETIVIKASGEIR